MMTTMTMMMMMDGRMMRKKRSRRRRRYVYICIASPYPLAEEGQGPSPEKKKKKKKKRKADEDEPKKPAKKAKKKKDPNAPKGELGVHLSWRYCAEIKAATPLVLGDVASSAMSSSKMTKNLTHSPRTRATRRRWRVLARGLLTRVDTPTRPSLVPAPSTNRVGPSSPSDSRWNDPKNRIAADPHPKFLSKAAGATIFVLKGAHNDSATSECPLCRPGAHEPRPLRTMLSSRSFHVHVDSFGRTLDHLRESRHDRIVYRWLIGRLKALDHSSSHNFDGRLLLLLLHYPSSSSPSNSCSGVRQIRRHVDDRAIVEELRCLPSIRPRGPTSGDHAVGLFVSHRLPLRELAKSSSAHMFFSLPTYCCLGGFRAAAQLVSSWACAST